MCFVRFRLRGSVFTALTWNVERERRLSRAFRVCMNRYETTILLRTQNATIQNYTYLLFRVRAAKRHWQHSNSLMEYCLYKYFSVVRWLHLHIFMVLRLQQSPNSTPRHERMICLFDTQRKKMEKKLVARRMKIRCACECVLRRTWNEFKIQIVFSKIHRSLHLFFFLFLICSRIRFADWIYVTEWSQRLVTQYANAQGFAAFVISFFFLSLSRSISIDTF